MEFRNPIVAGEELAITAIRSEDYSEGVDGWRVARDGSAQFRNLSTLGDFGATGNISGDAFFTGPSGLWLPDNTEVGQRLATLDDATSSDPFNPQPGQVICGATYTVSQQTTATSTTTEIGLFEMDTGFLTKTGWYQVYIAPALYAANAALSTGQFTPRVRATFTTDGVTVPASPTIASGVDQYGYYVPLDTTGFKGTSCGYYRYWNAGERHRLLWCIAVSPNTLTMSIYATQTLSGTVSYMGTTPVSNLGASGKQYNAAWSAGGGSEPPPVTPPPAPKAYTKTYYPVWSRSYDGDNSTTFDDSAHCYHGYYSSDRGNTKSLIGFPYTTIMSDLAGSSISSVDLFVTVTHAYYNAGVDVWIGGHAITSKPSTWVSTNVSERISLYNNLVAGSTYALNLTSTFATNFRSGVYKGIAIGPPSSTAKDFYGYLYGATESKKPYLVIKYTK